MSANDEKVREMLNKEPVPQELEPEKIKIMLDEKAPAKKRRNIKKTAARITAGAAACAVICGTSVYFAGQKDSFNKGKLESDSESRKSATSSVEGNKPLIVNRMLKRSIQKIRKKRIIFQQQQEKKQRIFMTTLL